MKSDHINQVVEGTLSSLDNMERAEVSPYFYTRLETKIQVEKPSAWNTFLQQLNRPAIAVSILSVFLVLNIMAIRGISTNNVSSQPRPSALQSFAAEYNLSTNVVYANSGK